MKIWELPTPAVIVDVDVVDKNLGRLASYCNKHRLNLRPHTKTHKIPQLAQRQVDFGAIGITVAKLGEAEVMADGGLKDILVAYPLYGEEKWHRLSDLAHRVAVTVSIDSVEVAVGISSRLTSRGSRVGILVEFDTGFGRCGLPIDGSSISLVKTIAELPGLDYRGVLVYPGHFLVPESERERLLEEENQKMETLLDLLVSNDLSPEVVSGGSTPTAYMAHRFKGITEIRSGTYIFNDKNTVGCGAAAYEDCAVSVLTTVVSTSVAGRAVVDAGNKTLSSDRLLSGDGQGFGYLPEAPDVLFESMSEEHGHLRQPVSNSPLKLGQKLRVIPNHVCPCMNMHDWVYAVEGEDVIDKWQVAGRGKVQ